MAAARDGNFSVEYTDAAHALVTIAHEVPGLGPGHLRTHQDTWLEVSRIRAIEGWIDGSDSGVRAHLDDDSRIDVMFQDSGNVDYTATWNEYLYDGAWAYGAGRLLAQWLGVPYRDSP